MTMTTTIEPRPDDLTPLERSNLELVLSAYPALTYRRTPYGAMLEGLIRYQISIHRHPRCWSVTTYAGVDVLRRHTSKTWLELEAELHQAIQALITQATSDRDQLTQWLEQF